MFYVKMNNGYQEPATYLVHTFASIVGDDYKSTATSLTIVDSYDKKFHTTEVALPYEAVELLFEAAQKTGKAINLSNIKELQERYEQKTGPFAPPMSGQSRGPG